MAVEVLPLAQLKLATGPSPVTAEQRYWRSFKNQKSHTSTASWPISHISFPTTVGATTSNSLVAAAKLNDLFAVTSGPRVDIFSIRKREPLKTIGRFDSEAHSGEIRADGRVLVAGEDSGKMQVFDVGGGTRAVILKTWHIHKQPVWVTRWSPTELTTLMSASDDKTVRLWDLPSNNPSRMFTGHSDYVRCGAFMPGGNSNLIVSGSYDETVRVWDARSPGGSVLTFKHADPIEDVLPLPLGTTLLAAAGSAISVLDLVAAKPLRLITNHQKTVTSLSLASNGRRVVSGSLDGHVKVFETSGWNVVAGSKYPSPVLSIAVIAAGATQEDRHLAVGMQSGVLSLRTRLSGSAAEKARERAAEEAARDIGPQALDKLDSQKAKRKRKAVSNKAMALLGESVDVIIPTEATNSAGGRARRVKLRPWQEKFRRGRYAAALDDVVDMSGPDYQPVTALTLFVALRHRSALREALEGRDEVTVLPLLRWVSKYISDPRYVSVCVDVTFHLLDIYSEYVGGSSELADQFQMLWGKVSKEVEKAQMAIITTGMVESLMIGRME
ncbi:WD40-repeat-containing domain protein [Lasiosphaeria miniovina]|uniref:WD40-repeat-containing domain protein n=1 Tax=Lasiosphaeria miniovina TaxID=1954250 RepID=A0AA40E7N1_9PEZI|nr:WD40-repeat-containing domain protein [Lasiosphaeria miniovina]KAK0727026.1 WD40-repeat-containing domain protein [Lasiosphaeria miniovina]